MIGRSSMKTLRIAYLVAVVSVLFGFVGTASSFAVGPAVDMEQIRVESFETVPLASDWTIAPVFDGQYLSRASWAPVTLTKYELNRSLWCSGSNPVWWPTYYFLSRSEAQLDLPQLEHFYDSWVSFYYSMPSVGVADYSSFSVGWTEDGGVISESYGVFALTPGTSWLKRTYHPSSPEISSVGNEVNVSRKSASFSLRWYDFLESGTQYPTEGRGPAVDYLVVEGYRYGPPRDLVADAAGGDVELSWSPPAMATWTDEDDTRSIGYRVWRAVDGLPTLTWTELTSARVSSLAFTDSTVVAGTNYRYAVQAWDSGSGTAHGVATELTVRAPSVGIDLSITAPSPVLAGATVPITYSVHNTGDLPTAPLALEDGFGNQWVVGILAADESFEYATSQVVDSPIMITAEVTDSGDSVVATSQRYIETRTPGVGITVEPQYGTVAAGDQLYVGFSVTNEGDTPLYHAVVRDSSNVLVGELDVLAVGETRQVGKGYTIDAARAFSGSVVAQYGISGQFFSGSIGPESSGVATVDVVLPRLAGATRYDTAVVASKSVFDSSDNVVLAAGTGFPDALSAAALAGELEAPLLLVGSDSLPTGVEAEINRLGAKTAYVVGGTAVIGQSVRDAVIARTGVTSVVALGGSNRYATARLVSARVRQIAGADPDTVVLATGLNFPDALAASSLAASRGWPILLTKRDSLPDDTAAALAALKPDTVLICGGSAVVSDAVKDLVSGNVAFGSPATTRVGGANRYATARLLVEYGVSRGMAPDGIDGVYLATGTNYPDALSGGIVAALSKGDGWRPLMLTESTALHSETRRLITDHPTVGFVVALGGYSAVSQAVLDEAASLIQ